MIASDLALAFNEVNERKAWTARSNTRDNTELVHFINQGSLIAIIYDCQTDRFQVKFNKVHAAWGDYIKAIARAMYIVLNTLKIAGMTLDAPTDYENIEIIATSSNDNTVYVRWAHQTPISDGEEPTLFLPFQNNTNLVVDTADTAPNVNSVETDTQSDGEF